MQVIFNYILFFLIYFCLQIFLYRFFKININKLPIVLSIIGASFVFGFYFYSLEMVMILININLAILCFCLIMPGIINHGPGLEIVDLINNKKINKKDKLKKLFKKSKVGHAVEKRLKINISSNLIKISKGGFFVNKNAKRMLIFFNFIRKLYRLKSDAY